MKVLDLFSGIGGFSLGLERAGMETIAFCEIEPFCQKVLKKHWPDVPVFDDIRKLTANELPKKPDVICGGYPCQPFSVAGKQRGKEDDRHLWPEMFRLIREIKPAWIIAENVAGHVNLGLDEVLFDLESEGYQTQPFVIPACSLNAHHRRDRVWIVGHSEHNGSPTNEKYGKPEENGNHIQKGAIQASQSTGASSSRGSHKMEILGNTCCSRMQVGIPEQEQWQKGKPKKSNNRGNRLNGWSGNSIWSTEPDVGRVADGIPDRVDRIKSLGNSVVPQIPEIIGKAILATYLVKHGYK